MVTLYYNKELICTLITNNTFTVDGIMEVLDITEEDVKYITGVEEIDYERFEMIIE